MFDVVKHGWITGLGAGQYLTWTVNVDQGGVYDATLMVDAGVAIPGTYALTITGTSESISASAPLTVVIQ